MSKNLKTTYILFFIFSAILVAWKTLSNFFGGVAINCVALIGLVFVVSLLSCKDKEIFARIKDLLIISGVFCVLELVIYFSHEFGYGEIIKGFEIYQNIVSFCGLLFLIYVGFRFTTDFLNKKIKFIEILLGNEKPSQKQKKAKELTNGSLEDKPNKKAEESYVEDTNQSTNDEDTTIIIETEE